MSGSDATNDAIMITADGRKISAWKSIAITRSAEMFPNSFAFTMSEEFSNDPSKILINPGKGICQVFLGEDLVITGYVDRYTAAIRPGAHDVEITGRGLGEDLVDCSADLTNPDSPIFNGQISAANALDLAQKLCKLPGISVRSAVADLGRPIRLFQIYPGETPYELIERVGRYAGYLVYEDESGAVVLDRVGTLKMASGFAQGVNIEAASCSLSVDQRFSDYHVIWGTVNQLSEGTGVILPNQRATATDEAMKNDLKRNRPRIIVSTQIDGTPDGGPEFALRMAIWEKTRRFGRSQAVQITCDSWRDSAGKLWQPNYLAPVHIPALKLVNTEWIIATVVYRKDQSGTHADLTLMPPDAFSVQPSTLQLFDNEIGRAIAQSQDPAPPSTLTGPS
jgi:prophage tail gpP-like protein